MKKYLLIYAVAMTAFAFYTYRHYHGEARRLTQNQTALASELTRYRTRWGAEAASAQALQLRCNEYEQLRADDAARIRALGIRIKRLEAAGKTVAAFELEAAAPLHDTVFVRLRDTVVVRDTLRLFRWRDTWVTVEGTLRRDSIHCRVQSVDTLRQIVHRIPRRFLFFRWGTKALRQEIVPANPHTRIVYTEYIKIER